MFNSPIPSPDLSPGAEPFPNPSPPISPVSPRPNSSPYVLPTPDSQRSDILNLTDNKLQEATRLIFVASPNPKPRAVVHISATLLEAPDKEENIAVQQLNITNSFSETETKHSQEIDPKQVRKALAGQIAREGQAGSLRDRVRMRATAQEIQNATGRIARSQGINLALNLPRFRKSQNPVTKLIEASYLPMSTVTTLLNENIEWDARITSDNTGIEKYEPLIKKVQNRSEHAKLKNFFTNFSSKIESLIETRDDEEFQEEFYRKELGENFNLSDLGVCFREVYDRAVERFSSDVKKLSVSRDPNVHEIIKLSTEASEELFQGNVAFAVKEKLNGLFKKDDVLSALRLWSSQITWLPPYSDLATLAIENQATASRERALEIRNAVTLLKAIESLNMGKKTATQKTNIINQAQQRAFESIQILIAKLSRMEEFASSSYVEANVVLDFLRTLNRTSIFIFTKDQNQSQEHTEKDVQTTGKLLEVSFGEKLLQHFKTMTQYVSSKEILLPHLGSDREEFVSDIVHASLDETTSYLPLQKIQNHLKLIRTEDPYLEDINLTNVSLHYRKDDILAQLEKAKRLEENESDEYLKEAVERVGKHLLPYLSKDELDVLLPADDPEKWKIIENLTAYVLPEELKKISTDEPTNEALSAAIDKTRMEMIYPADFSFKLGLENSRELLMNSLLSSLGSLGQFILPKFAITVKGASLLGTPNPSGIAAVWKKGVEVDYSAWFNYNLAKATEAQYLFYKTIIAEEPNIESELNRLKLERSPSLKQGERMNKLTDRLILIASAKIAMLHKPMDEVLKTLKETEDFLCQPESQESILSSGIIDMLFGSFDSHKQQFINVDGVYYNIDCARFGLPFPLYQSNQKTFLLLRSFCLDHPFSTRELPKAVREQVLKLNPDEIENEWRAKGLIGDDAYFEQHNIFASLKDIALLFDAKNKLEKANNFEELRKADNNVDPSKYFDFADAKTSVITLYSDYIVNKIASNRLIQEARQVLIKPLRDRLREIKTTTNADTFRNAYGLWVDDGEIEKLRPSIIKDMTEQIGQMESAKTFDDFESLQSGFILPFLQKQATAERIQREEKLCFSKLTESAVKRFKNNLLAFQKYLLDKGPKATLREGTETVYFYLKPFLDAYQRITGEPFENLSIKINGRDVAYAPLEDCIYLVNQNRSLFTDKEYNLLLQTYEDLKNGKVKGLPIGKKSDNYVAADY